MESGEIGEGLAGTRHLFIELGRPPIYISPMRKTAYGTALFTLAGGLFIAAPPLEAFHIIPETPDSPPLASVASSTATGGWDTMLDVAYDVRPHPGVTTPST